MPTMTGPLVLVNYPEDSAFAAVPASVTLAVVTGVDGTGSNAASKADVDARFATIQTALNALLERLG